tara:strand:+ start:2365 stop:3057 length:693 start_codon:yes stop_codon:yes gene_type:complete
MKAMILAAGRGQRMGSLTKNTPKPLTIVNGMTLIEYNITRLRDAGIEDIVINVSWLGDKIKSLLGNGKNLGVHLTFFDEGDHMLGTGGGILNAIPYLGKNPFWLINADLYSDFPIDPSRNLNKNTFAHLILVKNPIHHPDGDFFLNGDKVEIASGPKPYTYSGMSIISPSLFCNCKEKIFPLEPLLEDHASKGNLTGEFYDGVWTDVGTQERLTAIQKYLKKNSGKVNDK